MSFFIITSLCISMKCQICQAELTGKQKMFCSRKCHNQSSNKKNQDYNRQQLRGLSRKLSFVKRLGGKCCKCGYDKNLAALTFHHLDPSVKEFGLDIRKFSNSSMERLEEEVSKCQLYCHNCHTELHHPRLDMRLVGSEGIEPPTYRL